MKNLVFLVFFIVLVVEITQSLRITGGFRELDVRNADVIRISNAAIWKYNSQQNSNSRKYDIVRLVKARSQVVSGTRYDLNFKAKRRDCSGRRTCVQYNCVFSVWEQPWLTPSIQLIKSECR